MENVFKYFEFSDFFKDKSDSFSGNEICFTVLNETHFLIFEKVKETHNLYVTKYNNKTEIGVSPALILELVVENYDKSIPAHRIAIRQYLG